MYHIMRSNKWPKKAVHFTDSIIQAANNLKLNFTFSAGYRECKNLVLYGLGGADRYNIAMSHLNKGGRLICFDLGYWDRSLPIYDRKYRVSIDGFHPKNIMNGKYHGESRWVKANKKIKNISAKTNKIMIVGNAPKSIAVGAEGWTAIKSKEIKKHFPNSEIIYRPKPKRPLENGVLYNSISTGKIENDLKGVSLVVCRHSNVAIDACILGVPVVCDDGAASCIYPKDLIKYNQQPTLEKRTEFLHRLSFWQWSANESIEFWLWLEDTINEA